MESTFRRKTWKLCLCGFSGHMKKPLYRMQSSKEDISLAYDKAEYAAGVIQKKPVSDVRPEGNTVSVFCHCRRPSAWP